MGTIDRELLLKRFRQLKGLAVRWLYGKKGEPTEISFRSGLWWKEEGYKYDVWEQARILLEIDTWSLDDPEAIIEKVKSSLVFRYNGDEQHNLISASNYKP